MTLSRNIPFKITFLLLMLYIGGITGAIKIPPETPTFALGDSLIPPHDLAKYESEITPSYYETSEYLIGSVAVGIILPESDGGIDSSTEQWTSSEESNIVGKIQHALNWWASQNPSAGVSLRLDVHFDVLTKYEPIRRPRTDQNLWISDCMLYIGYSGTYYFTQVRDYVNALRTRLNTKWAFAIFVVDSSSDSDGKFADNSFAYSYLGGPFLVMTYDNDGWGIDKMDLVTAHEIGHIFYATDEYDGVTESSGYLNVADVEGSGGIMDGNGANWFLSSGTRGQVGWQDSDGDGLQDIVDTFPDTIFEIYSPNPTYYQTITFTGSATENPYPNMNPKGGKDVTINTIAKVEWSIDSSTWFEATPIDGTFDEAVEDFTFITPSLTPDIYTIEARAVNSVNNVGMSYVLDIASIIADSFPPVISSVSLQNGSQIRSTSVRVSWVGFDELSGIDHYEVKLDDKSWIDVETNTTYTLTRLAEGTHVLQIKAFDKKGNHEQVQISFQVNMSLIGGPGWLDDFIVFGPTATCAVIATAYLIIKKQKHLPAKPGPPTVPITTEQTPPAGKFCPQCGMFVAEEEKFCSHCGKKLE